MEYQAIDRSQLKQKLANEAIDNVDSKNGLAIVNVLGSDQFDKKHIPNSINIPLDELDRFEQKFSRQKDIVVYCASSDCDASPKAAKALSDRGFSNIYDYEGGTADWESGNEPVAGSAALPGQSPS